MKPRRYLVLAAALVACGRGPGDELRDLAASDTNCRALPPEAYALNEDVARGIALDLADTSRALTIGVDSMNRVRVINTSTRRKLITDLTVHNSSASFSADGAMSNAVRTISEGNVEQGLRSNSVSLSDADTARLRTLANEAAARCRLRG